MRTTISLKNTLLAQLKKRAADMGTSVSTLIEQAVRLVMQSSLRGKSKKPFKLVTYGGSGKFSSQNQNIDNASRLLEQDDLEKFGRE